MEQLLFFYFFFILQMVDRGVNKNFAQVDGQPLTVRCYFCSMAQKIQEAMKTTAQLTKSLFNNFSFSRMERAEYG